MRIKLGRPMLLKQIATLGECTLYFSGEDACQTAIGYLTTDTREILPGDLFVALATEKDDGHAYLSAAYEKGASAALIRTDCVGDAPPMCLLAAQDTMSALVSFAAGWADSIPHRTIAVTGSVGKTTTRHLLASVLGERYRIHESSGNFNNLLGTALTLLSMSTQCEYLVAECGMDAPGQISRISQVLHPDISVITGIGISHLEKLKTKEAICHAKLEILDGMKPDGRLYCPSVEPLLCHMANRIPRTFSVYDSGADCHMENVHPFEIGMHFDLLSPDGRINGLHVPILSETVMPGVACAAGIALDEGVTEDELRRGLARYKTLPLRQDIQMLGGILVLLDCYNACPASMKAAGETARHLRDMTGGKVVALLGDMTELGAETESGHLETGTYMASLCDSIFAIGHHADLYAAGLSSDMSPRMHTFPADGDREEIADLIASCLRPSDVLLIKGSRVCRLETFLPLLKNKLS